MARAGADVRNAETARAWSCDYIAGMTDTFALDEHKRLFVENPLSPGSADGG